jgi:hypothetical protein
MKTPLIIALTIVLTSCAESVQTNPVPIKPFIITGRAFTFSNRDICTYHYHDKNGNKFSFSDRTDKYEIGDTLGGSTTKVKSTMIVRGTDGNKYQIPLQGKPIK